MIHDSDSALFIEHVGQVHEHVGHDPPTCRKDNRSCRKDHGSHRIGMRDHVSCIMYHVSWFRQTPIQAHHLRYHYKTTDGDPSARARPGGGSCLLFGRFNFVRGPVRDPTASPPRSFSSWLSVYQRPQSPRACSPPCIAFRRCSNLKLCSTPASAGWSLFPTSCE